MRVRILALACCLLAACSSNRYTTPLFDVVARDHQVVAVLPFEMVFTGKAPKGLTAEQILEIEEAESVAFQAAFANRLLHRSSAGRRRPIGVEILPADETNRRLEEGGIGIRDAWRMDPERLAATLGVDAVVHTRVEKTRYLSDLASFGLEVGFDLLAHELSDGEVVLLPVGLFKTHDIFAGSRLLDGRDGRLLWQVDLAAQADWTRSANALVYGVTKRLAKRFPYRG